MDQPAANPQPSRRLFPETWHPPANAFFAVVCFYGPQEQVMQRVEEFTRSQPHVVLHLDPTLELPSDAWDRLPPRFLTTVQQAIVREDLRGTKREVIAEKLIIGTNTVTAYRYHIRRQFLSIPLDEHPAWMLAWLQRFPGRRTIPKRARTKNQEPGSTGKNQEPRTKNQNAKAKNPYASSKNPRQEPRTKNQEPQAEGKDRELGGEGGAQ